MGFLSLYNETVLLDAQTGERIQSEAEKPEWWIRVRNSLPTIDFEAAQRALLSAGIDLSTIDREKLEAGDPEGAALAVKPDMTAFQVELLSRSIVDWNLTDEEDNPLPLGRLTDDLVDETRRNAQVEITRASLRRLPGELFMVLFRAVNSLGGPRGSAERVQFRAGAASGDQAAPAGTADPLPVRS
jgi:hypothetical protein